MNRANSVIRPISSNEDGLGLKLALQLRNQGNFEGSIKLIFDLLKKSDCDSQLFFIQGLNYMNTGRLVIAIGFFNKYLSYYPYDAQCWSLIGFCILKYTSYRDSIFYLRSAIHYGASESNVFAHLGEAYFRSNLYKKALRCLQKAHLLGGVRDKKRLYDFMFRSINNILDKSQLSNEAISDSCYLVAHDLKQALNVKNILCLGDSHTLIFEGVLGLDVFQTGSPTAYNLISENSQSKSIGIIRQLLSNYNPKSTAVMLTYAEIDIRNHIYKQMVLRDMTLEEACSIVVDRYHLVIAEIESLGFKLLINGPFGSGFGVPRVGTEVVRNKIALKIDQMLRSLCEKKGWLYHSLCDIMIGPNHHINRGYFGEVDDNHLNKSNELKYFILASFLQQARKYFPRTESESIVQNTPYLAVLFKKDSISYPPALLSLIDNQESFYDGPLSSNYNQIIFSLSDHIQVSRISIKLNSSFIIDSNLYYRVGLHDSQMNEVENFSGTVNPAGIINIVSSNCWTWYISLDLSYSINPSAFSSLSIN